MKSFTHFVGEFGFDGPTRAEAKAKSKAAVEETFKGRWSPLILHYRGCITLVYRSPGGWAYRSSVLHEGEGELNSCSTVCGDPSFEAASRSARFGLAQRGWTHEDGPDFVPEFVTDEEDRSELQHWQKWQIRYQGFKEQGHSADVCHAMASDHRYELIAA